MSDSSDSRFSVIEVTNSGHCAVVEFREEDHTLCNALRHEIVNNPLVKFCGYSMPHPNDTVCLMQIQTTTTVKEPIKALEALEEGLISLREKCRIVKTKFEQKHKEFVNDPKNTTNE